jgi:ATP-binding cassette subfamily F protein 3
MISVKNLSHTFGTQTLFSNVTFNINTGDKIGLVGRNGSGKTTLFALLNKEMQPDSGEISLPKGYSIGYVKQHLEFSQNTVLGEGCLGLRPDEQYNEWQVEKILFGLGFTEEDLYRDPREMSGGYQVRLNLAKILAFEPNMLLLDEPTNYLDIKSARWLMGFLKAWRNELVIISHDRHFMDSITNHTMAIHRQKIKKIRGSSLDVYAKIEEEEEIYEKTRLNKEKRDEKTITFINTFRSKANIAKLVQSRIKALEKSEKIEKLENIKTLDFYFNEAEFHAKNFMEVNSLFFRYSPETPYIIRKFSLSVEKHDRICVIGKNGIGKSTLLKLLYGALTPELGTIKKHPATQIGFFGQTNISTLNPNNTIEEELLTCCKTGNRQDVRNICGTMMFSGDFALKKIGVISGGEKSRVLLGKILLTPSNLLLLDEPTHHLDIESCDVLVEALEMFSGASIIVTHNETFLHLLAKKLIVFSERGIHLFHGTYQDFLDKNDWE